MNNSLSGILWHRANSVTPQSELECEAREIVNAHNDAALYGFIDLGQLLYCNVVIDDLAIYITVQPRSGSISIHDLYNLKELWGADDVEIDKEGIVLMFNKTAVKFKD